MSRASTSRVFLLLVASGALAAGGCQNPPTGQSEGRIPVGQSTSAEAQDPRPLPDDLVDFSDRLSESLIRDLPGVPALMNAPERVTLLYGQIDNRTGIVPSDEFEMVRERMKDNLLKSRTFNERFRFLVDRATLEQIRSREVYDAAVGERFNRPTTYVINGSMFRSARGPTNFYYMNFELMNFDTGELVWSERYESKRFAP